MRDSFNDPFEDRKLEEINKPFYYLNKITELHSFFLDPNKQNIRLLHQHTGKVPPFGKRQPFLEEQLLSIVPMHTLIKDLGKLSYSCHWKKNLPLLGGEDVPLIIDSLQDEFGYIPLFGQVILPKDAEEFIKNNKSKLTKVWLEKNEYYYWKVHISTYFEEKEYKECYVAYVLKQWIRQVKSLLKKIIFKKEGSANYNRMKKQILRLFKKQTESNPQIHKLLYKTTKIIRLTEAEQFELWALQVNNADEKEEENTEIKPFFFSDDPSAYSLFNNIKI